MKTLSEITLYDLMAEDIDVWMKTDEKFGINMQLSDEKGDIIVDDEHVHPYAMESLADFCKQYLRCYERMSNLQ